ncbi:T9SS type A sorting domain-containing protein [Pontibacter sp. G13]|uniref:T9SS type A sorting domain-containing protein n=1 Tax=Pontibacter sp. G13 TaxID=3074898 RepID=UPI00288B9A4B|nr:T9SS type A sorting domain-containing protein [Pontibacter sp. G13]WNJ16452.1 T9SS type A sorting domain-containing protein [Pontibacter sp. G13]
MKRLPFVLLFTIVYASVFSQNTLYTTGLGNQSWSDPASWTLDPQNPEPAGPPSAQDHLVINHPITYILDGDHVHTGDLHVGAYGNLELISFFGSGHTFGFSGEEMTIEGELLVSGDLEIDAQSPFSHSVLMIENQGLVTIGGDLNLDGHAGAMLEGSVCGAVQILGDLRLLSTANWLCGTGSMVVSGDVEMWDQQVLLESEIAEIYLAERICSEIYIYQSIEDCGKQANPITGYAQFMEQPNWEQLDVQVQDAQAEISWEMELNPLQAYFHLERSSNGFDFEPVGRLPILGGASKAARYEMTDELIEQHTLYYRVALVLRNGDRIYSDIHEVATPSIHSPLVVYPNPAPQDGRVSIAAAGWNGDQDVHVQVTSLTGQMLSNQAFRTDTAGLLHVDFSHDLAAGVYVMVLSQGNDRRTELLRVF